MSRKGSGDICTNEEYAAFELTLDFKIAPAGNSGVMYHVKETGGAPWFSDLRSKSRTTKKGHDPQKCGWLYQLYPAEVDATKPAGQWNTLRVSSRPPSANIT